MQGLRVSWQSAGRSESHPWETRPPLAVSSLASPELAEDCGIQQMGSFGRTGVVDFTRALQLRILINQYAPCLAMCVWGGGVHVSKPMS